MKRGVGATLARAFPRLRLHGQTPRVASIGHSTARFRGVCPCHPPANFVLHPTWLDPTFVGGLGVDISLLYPVSPHAREPTGEGANIAHDLTSDTGVIDGCISN